MIFKFLRIMILFSFFYVSPIMSRDCDGKDVFLEFKGGAFIPTGCDFRSIYGSATFFVSPEFSWQVVDHANWYIFASAGYSEKEGSSKGLCTPTKVRLVPLAIGVKYFFQDLHADFCKNHKLYLGLGFQPVLLQTNNCSEFVEKTTSQWGFGGVAKLGYLLDLRKNFFLDFFADYSFVNVGCKKPCNSSNDCDSVCSTNNGYVTPLKANISGAILGMGIGYSF